MEAARRVEQLVRAVPHTANGPPAPAGGSGRCGRGTRRGVHRRARGTRGWVCCGRRRRAARRRVGRAVAVQAVRAALRLAVASGDAALALRGVGLVHVRASVRYAIPSVAAPAVAVAAIHAEKVGAR